MNLLVKKRVILKYVLLGLWIGLIFLVNRFIPEMPLTLLLIVATLLFLPGFFLAQIFKITINNDPLGQFILWLTLGFILAFSSGLFGIILGLTLPVLTNIYLLLIAGLFILSFILDWRRPQDSVVKNKLALKNILKLENLIYLLVIATVLLILLVLLKSGALFKGGDTNYHLATVRKVISGQPLTIDNLNYVKDKIAIIAYGFPLWHVWLGMLIHVTKANIFAIWHDMAMVLTVLVFLVWFWFCRKIFPTRDLGILAFLLFAIFSFYWGAGYLFTTLSIPHTLTQILLFPLSVILAFEFIFNSEKKPNSKLFVVLLIFVLLTAAVHLTAYFYYLFVLFSLAIFYPIFNFKAENFWPTFKKLLLLLGTSLVIILPLALALELKGHTISANLASFRQSDYSATLRYSTFARYGPFSHYAYLGLPLVLLFLKKYRNLFFILATFLIAPIVYLPAIGVPLIKTFSAVMVGRLYGTLEWHFLVWALVLGFGLIIIDRLIFRLSRLSKYFRWLIDLVFAFGAGLLVWLQVKFNWATTFYDSMFADKTLNWLDRNWLWLVAINLGVAIAGLLLAKYWGKANNFFALSEPKDHWARLFLIFIIVFILISPNYALFKKSLQNNNFKYFIRPRTNVANVLTDYYNKYAGGEREINFINSQIPAKSVFDTNVAYFILPIVVDQHMPLYSSNAETNHLDLYQDDVAIAARLKILCRYQIDYILVKKPKKGTPVFDGFPQYFTQIFQDKNIIYQINKEKVQKDCS